MLQLKVSIFCALSMIVGLFIGVTWMGSSQLERVDQLSDSVVFPMIQPCNEEIHSLLQAAVMDKKIAYKIHGFNSGGPILELVTGWVSIESSELNIFELKSVSKSILTNCYPNIIEEHMFNEESRVKMSLVDSDSQYKISLWHGLHRKDFFREQ